MRRLSKYFEDTFRKVLRHVPPDLLFISPRSMPADYLRGGEHICLVLHAGNTEAEIDEFIGRMERWATKTLQAEEAGTSMREAATRVFSNASGSYSSNVNLAVENSSWQDESQLQEMYISRKSFAFNSDQWAPPLTPCVTPQAATLRVKAMLACSLKYDGATACSVFLVAGRCAKTCPLCV